MLQVVYQGEEVNEPVYHVCSFEQLHSLVQKYRLHLLEENCSVVIASCQLNDLADIYVKIENCTTLESSFTESVNLWMKKKEISPSQLFQRANIDRKLYYDICSSNAYHPKRETAMAICIGLKLNLDQSKELLKKAGYAFSGSSLFDQIVHLFIEYETYDILLLNETLYRFTGRILR